MYRLKQTRFRLAVDDAFGVAVAVCVEVPSCSVGGLEACIETVEESSFVKVTTQVTFALACVFYVRVCAFCVCECALCMCVCVCKCMQACVGGCLNISRYYPQ